MLCNDGKDEGLHHSTLCPAQVREGALCSYRVCRTSSFALGHHQAYEITRFCMQTCKRQYCPSHRFPKDHSCVAPSVSGGKPSAVDKPKQSAAATLAAFRRAAKPSSTGAPSSTTVNKPTQSPTPVKKVTVPSASTASAAPSSNQKPGTNPFSKTDR
jgi:hypothetical protein